MVNNKKTRNKIMYRSINVKNFKIWFFIMACVIVQVSLINNAFSDVKINLNDNVETVKADVHDFYMIDADKKLDLASESGIYHNIIKTYGPHTSRGHAVYTFCTLCNKTTPEGKYAKIQNCTTCYTSPTVTIKNLSPNITLGKSDTNFKLQIEIRDSKNMYFLCEYFINEKPQPNPGGGIIYSADSDSFSKNADEFNYLEDSSDNLRLLPSSSDGEYIADARTPKLVTFRKTINTAALPQGENTITVKVIILNSQQYSSGFPVDKTLGYAKVIKTTFKVDTNAPVIKAVSASTTHNSASISVSAADVSSPIEYRYIIGSNATGWLPSQNTYNAENLLPNTAYSYNVETRDIKGSVSSSRGSFTTKAQSPIINLSAVSNNSIKINISDNNPADTLYKIKVGGKHLSVNGALSDSASWILIPSKSITAFNLFGNTEYKITVYAKDRQNGAESPSQEVSIKTTPLPPAGLTCSNRTNNSISLIWNASAGAYVYDLLRETIENGIVTNIKQIDNIMATTYTDANLLPKQTYRYKIRAKLNSTVYGDWSSSSLETATSPNKPPKVLGAVTSLQPSDIRLSWTPQPEAVGYEILINNQQKLYCQSNEVTIPFDTANMQYSLSIRAYNMCDVSNPSDTAKWTNYGEWSDTAIIYTPSNAPKNIVINNLTFDSIQFTWDKNNNPDSVSYKCGVYNGDKLIKESNEINTNSYSFSGLASQTQYTVKIYSINSNKIMSSGEAVSTFTTKISPPEAPSQLRTTAKNNQITVSWESSARAKFYTIKRNNIVIADNITGSKFLDTGLIPETAYTYEVIASNESGALSALIVGKTKGEAPCVPDGIKADRFNTYIQLSWNSVIGAIGYDIKCDGKIYNTELKTGFEHMGLNPGSSHTYSVRARNIHNNGEWSTPITVMTISGIPDMPGEVNLTAGQTKIDISWTPVSNAESYVVNVDGIEIPNITIPEYTYVFDSTVKSESEHIIKIMAVNEGGQSGYTSPKSIRLLPKISDAPEVTGTVKNSSIYVTWNNVENALEYEINIDNAASTTVSAITTSYVDFNSSLTQPHTYKVRAIFDEKEGSWSYPITVKAIPSVPLHIVGTPGQNIISLRWDKCDTANIYELSADNVIIYVGYNTEFIHSSLLDNSTHQYMVRAGNQSGYSQWSELIEVTAKKELSNIPQNVKPSKVNQGLITVSWDLVKDAKCYAVKINGVQKNYVNVPMIGISTTPQAFYTVSVAAVFDEVKNILGEWSEEISFIGPAEIPAVPVIKDIEASEFSIKLNWDNVTDAQGYEVEIENSKIVKAYSNSYHDFDIPSKTTRSYRIRSYNETGMSEWSESISAATNEALPGVPINILCKFAPATSGSAISISWGNVDNAVSYEVKDLNGSSYMADNSSITIDGLINGTLYKFQVRALTSQGQGAWSSTVYYVTDLIVPKNITASNTESGGIHLSWDTSNAADYYEVEMDDVILTASTSGSIDIPQANNYLTHSFRVRALNSYKTGEWTQPIVYSQNIPLDITVDEGEEFSVMMPVYNVKDMNQYKMAFVINSDELGIIDICEFTSKLETASTYFKENDMQIIVENKDGLCYITIFVKIEGGKEITGIINSIRLVGKKSCTSKINYSVTIIQ